MKSFVTHTTTQYATTYYVRDPQGNVLAVYERKRGETGPGTLTLTEQHLYGAGRIGMRKRNLALGGGAEEPVAPSTHYALTNHLGNVLAVISDAPGGGTQPTVESLTDYYPFGMAMPGRSYNASDYRYGYTGHEKEGDLAEGVYTTQYRLLDTRLGRWMSVDPLFGKYADMGAYNYCGGNPVGCWDPDGRRILIPNGDGKYVNYVPGVTNVSDISDDFGKSVVNALNYLYEHASQDASKHALRMIETINDLSNSEDYNLKIRYRLSSHYTPSGTFIEWNPKGGLITYDNERNEIAKLTPANGLYHEMGHAHMHLKVLAAEKEYHDSKFLKKLFAKHKLNMLVQRYEGPIEAQMGADEFTVKEYETDAAIVCEEFSPSVEHPYTRDEYPGGADFTSEDELSFPDSGKPIEKEYKRE